MKIVVVHGDDSAKSRSRFSTIVKGVKKKDWDVNYYNYKSKTNLGDTLANQTLFQGPTLYIVEEANKLSKIDLDWIKNKSDSYDSQLLIYSRSKIPATTLKAFGKGAKIEELMIPKKLFTFLESMRPQNSKQCLKLFEDLLDTQPAELVIAMLGRHLRDLYWVLEDRNGPGYPDWRIKKLLAQASKFTKLELAGIISELADIDYKSKTSGVDTKLLLEMMIVKRLT